jgi:hypothetical protein
MAQRAWQFKQEVAIHFSSGTIAFFGGRGWAEGVSNGPSTLLAPTAAPVKADHLRNVLLFIVNPFCSFSFDPNLPLFFIAPTPKSSKNR